MLRTKEEIKKTWDKIAKEYGGYRRKPWPPIKEFLDKVDADLLDIGSANCCYCSDILKQGHKIYAVDISAEMLKLAPKEIIKIKADATKIPIKRKFKYILAKALIHHLPTEKDRIVFLKEIKRLLTNDGEALITAWYSKEKGDKMVNWGGYKHSRYYHFFSKKELEDLLEKANIKNFSITKSKASIKINYIIKIKN
jgi:tRNA (uracil-5-)-methyltransferase TRM9